MSQKRFIPTPPQNIHERDVISPRKRQVSTRQEPQEKAIANHLARMIRRISLEPNSDTQKKLFPRVSPKVISRNSSQSTISSSRHASTSIETLSQSSSKLSRSIPVLYHPLDEILQRSDPVLIRDFPTTTHPELLDLLKEKSNAMTTTFTFRENYLVGLSNLGNTCYMNSILQCLLATKPFVSVFLAKVGNPKSVAHVFASFVNDYFDRTAGSRSPARLKQAIQQRAVQFHGYGQHDSQEFLRTILTELHNDLNSVDRIPKFTYTEQEFEKLDDGSKSRVSWNRYKRFDDSPIIDIFGGQLESVVTCRACDYKSITFDTFLDLSVPVTATNGSLYTCLDNCLDAYFREEELEELYKCSKCKSHQKATKKLSISRYPQILVIHLKRFKTEFGGYGMAKKLTHPLSFPTENLKLERYETYSCEKNLIYSLVSISNHFGNTNGGHYTATTRNWFGNGWSDRNDSHVTSITSTEATDSKSAYILFYQGHHRQ